MGLGVGGRVKKSPVPPLGSVSGPFPEESRTVLGSWGSSKRPEVLGEAPHCPAPEAQLMARKSQR